MSVNQMDAYYATCDWRDCRTTLENLTESEMQKKPWFMAVGKLTARFSTAHTPTVPNTPG